MLEPSEIAVLAIIAAGLVLLFGSALVLFALFLLAVGNVSGTPMAVAALAGIGSFCALGSRGIVGPQALVLSAICAAVFGILACSRRDWDGLDPATNMSPNARRDWLAVACAALGSVVGAVSGVGLPLLRYLGVDIVGRTVSEAREARIAGAVAGAFAGFLACVIVWAMISSRHSARGMPSFEFDAEPHAADDH